MADRKTLLFGIWAIIAIAAIVILVLLLMRWTSPAGAFTASRTYADLGPANVCLENGCEYMGHVFPSPSFGPGRVDCLCNGDLITFQLTESDLDMYYSYYPRVA